MSLPSDDHVRAADHDELDRLRQLEALAPLLVTLRESLDIRAVFERISAITKRVLPHDLMGLALLEDDRDHVRLYAVAADIEFEPPQRVRIPEEERERIFGAPWVFHLVDDIRSFESWREMPPVRHGMRSNLRVPMHEGSELIGGLSFFSRIVAFYSEAHVPVATRVAEYVALALSHQRLAEEAQRAAEARERAQRLERRVRALTEEVESLSGHGRRVVGKSEAWRHALGEATRVAATETTVLLTGESGTGKEVVARFIHHASPRATGPFVALNCAALPEPLLESELFGFERGAFTGAVQSKPGRLEQAGGGVLFLDEVAEMSAGMQAKLLRVLQEREFQRLGATRALKADVRIVTATNRNLRRMVDRGEFREDLYYRLHVFEIHLPPLRDRPDDILPLCQAFLDEIGRELGRPPAGLSREVRSALLGYGWPGNARELRNVLERASILADGGLITRDHLAGLEPSAGLARDGASGPPVAASPLPSAADPARETTVSARGSEPPTPLRDVERALVEDALKAVRYNKTRAARRLGITRSQLYVRLRRYGLE